MRNTVFLLFIIFLAACSKNAFDQYKQGDLEGAYETLYKKAKKNKLDRKERKLFQDVLTDIILEDSISYFRYLSFSDLPNNTNAYFLHRDMDERSREIDALRIKLPNYNFLQNSVYDSLSMEICEVLFENGSYLIQQALDSGAKEPAREAFSVFSSIEDFHTSDNYPIELKLAEAELLGTDFVLITMDANTFSDEFTIENYMEFRDLELRDGNWKVYHERRRDVDYEYLIDVVIYRAEFSQQSNTRSQNYSEQILIRYDVETDTSGVTTQTPVYETVNATVYTDEITRYLNIEGEVEVRQYNSNRYDETIRRYYREEKDAYRYSGDFRAVPSNLQGQMNLQPNFSSNDTYYRNAIEYFMEEAGDIIEDLR